MPGTGGWKTNVEGMSKLKAANRLMPTANSLRYVRYMNDFSVFPFANVWNDIGGVQSGGLVRLARIAALPSRP
jgi:adenine-specific DNA-methyltransferase